MLCCLFTGCAHKGNMKNNVDSSEEHGLNKITLVAEFNDATPENPQKGIIREYSAVVRHVSKLPVTVLK